jgi:hypothetical protein
MSGHTVSKVDMNELSDACERWFQAYIADQYVTDPQAQAMDGTQDDAVIVACERLLRHVAA